MALRCFSPPTGRCLSACPRAHPGLGVPPSAMCYESHLHPHWLGCQGKAELGCPEELRGMQGAGPLALPGDFGKHLSCPSQLKESLAAVLRKAMARLGWMRAGG